MITMPIEGGLREKLSIWNESLLDYVSVLERGLHPRCGVSVSAVCWVSFLSFCLCLSGVLSFIWASRGLNGATSKEKDSGVFRYSLLSLFLCTHSNHIHRPPPLT